MIKLRRLHLIPAAFVFYIACSGCSHVQTVSDRATAGDSTTTMPAVGTTVPTSTTTSSQSPSSTSSAPVTTSPSSLPGLSASVISAINGSDENIVPASSQTTPSVSEAAAVATVISNETQGASIVAGELVILTNGEYLNGRLVWAVQLIPAGGFGPSPGGPGPDLDTPSTTAGQSGPEGFTPSLQVDFVDATTGAWLGGDATK